MSTIKVQPIYFCPICKRRVNTPNYKMLANVSFGGNLNINCGWPGCKGTIKIKGNPEREKFIRRYMERSKFTKKEMDEFLETQVVLECTCGEEECEGWQMKSREVHERETKLKEEQSKPKENELQDPINQS